MWVAENKKDSENKRKHLKNVLDKENTLANEASLTTFHR